MLLSEIKASLFSGPAGTTVVTKLRLELATNRTGLIRLKKEKRFKKEPLGRQSATGSQLDPYASCSVTFSTTAVVQCHGPGKGKAVMAD